MGVKKNANKALCFLIKTVRGTASDNNCNLLLMEKEDVRVVVSVRGNDVRGAAGRRSEGGENTAAL